MRAAVASTAAEDSVALHASGQLAPSARVPPKPCPRPVLAAGVQRLVQRLPRPAGPPTISRSLGGGQ